MNATSNKPGEMPELPQGLDRRNEPKKPVTPQVPAMPGTAPLGVKASVADMAEKAKGKVEGTVEPHTDKPKAKQTAKAKTAPKREAKSAAKKPAGATHKPSEVKSTDKNPAKSIVPPSFKARYAEHNDSNGDRVALALAAFVHTTNEDGRPATDLKKLAEVAAANGVDFKRYAGLNVGQQRMNVGNRIRGILKSGKAVVIGKQRFANAETALKVQEPKAKTEKTAKAA